MHTNLRELFSSIAEYYDALNRAISFNRDKGWRKKAALLAGIKKDAKVLDVCTGTAEMAIQFIREYNECEIIGIDFSHTMLKKAKEKIIKLGLASRINLVEANALNPPFHSCHFDAVLISFGLRNLPDCNKAMKEIIDSLKEGGTAIILEFSPAAGNLFGKAAGFYISKLLPLIARLFGGSKEAYAHLSSSISGFILPQQIITCMESAGLKDLRYKNLYCGVVNSYYGKK